MSSLYCLTPQQKCQWCPYTSRSLVALMQHSKRHVSGLAGTLFSQHNENSHVDSLVQQEIIDVDNYHDNQLKERTDLNLSSRDKDGANGHFETFADSTDPSLHNNNCDVNSVIKEKTIDVSNDHISPKERIQLHWLLRDNDTTGHFETFINVTDPRLNNKNSDVNSVIKEKTIDVGNVGPKERIHLHLPLRDNDAIGHFETFINLTDPRLHNKNSDVNSVIKEKTINVDNDYNKQPKERTDLNLSLRNRDDANGHFEAFTNFTDPRLRNKNADVDSVIKEKSIDVGNDQLKECTALNLSLRNKNDANGNFKAFTNFTDPRLRNKNSDVDSVIKEKFIDVGNDQLKECTVLNLSLKNKNDANGNFKAFTNFTDPRLRNKNSDLDSVIKEKSIDVGNDQLKKCTDLNLSLRNKNDANGNFKAFKNFADPRLRNKNSDVDSVIKEKSIDVDNDQLKECTDLNLSLRDKNDANGNFETFTDSRDPLTLEIEQHLNMFETFFGSNRTIKREQDSGNDRVEELIHPNFFKLENIKLERDSEMDCVIITEEDATSDIELETPPLLNDPKKKCLPPNIVKKGPKKPGQKKNIFKKIPTKRVAFERNITSNGGIAKKPRSQMPTSGQSPSIEKSKSAVNSLEDREKFAWYYCSLCRFITKFRSSMKRHNTVMHKLRKAVLKKPKQNLKKSKQLEKVDGESQCKICHITSPKECDKEVHEKCLRETLRTILLSWVG